MSERFEGYAMRRMGLGIVALSLSWVALEINWGWAQYQGYGDYYSKNVGSARSPDPGTSRYLYDKYYYHNTAINPYISAVRGGSASGPAWQTSVRPELERRAKLEAQQRATIQQRKLQGNVGHTNYGSIGNPLANRSSLPVNAPSNQPWKSNGYFNQVYGGASRR